MSASNYYKSAVAIGDLKNAALYFEHLVPVFAVAEFARSVASKDKSKAAEWDVFRERVLGDLLPPHLLHESGFIDSLAAVNRQSFNIFAKFSIQKFGFTPQIEGLSQEQYDNVEVDLANAYLSFVRKYGLSDWPLAADGEPTSAGLPEDGPEQLQPIVTLLGLNLVDASSLPWEQVHAFRRDVTAQSKLRKLRLFAFENYSGKTRDFVEDDLLSRVSDYEACAKAWGLETTQGALSLVMNSKLAAGALAGSFVSAMFGQPVAALIAGTAGVILEVSNIALEVQKRQLAVESLSRENPVSYISYVREALMGRDAC